MPGNAAGKSASSSDKSSSRGGSSSRSSSRPSSPAPSSNGGAKSMPWPALIPLGHHQGKPAIPLMRPVMLIGSRHNAHLHLLSRQISKAHALLINSDGKVYIRDLASRTHVYVNGQEVREADLVDGDMLKIGSFTFRFQAAAGMKQKAAPDTTPAGQLEITGGQFPLQIDERVMLIGRRAACEISLMEESCSTAHAVIFSMGGKRYVRDLGSRTGTLVNGTAVRQQEISFGDTIHIGDSDLRYQSSASTGLTSAADELQDLVGTGPLISEAGREEVAAETESPLDLDFDLGAVESDLPEHTHVAEASTPVEGAIPIAGEHDDALAIAQDAEEEPQMLVGDNLMGEKLSSSNTGANMQAAAREAMELAGRDESPQVEKPSAIEVAHDEPLPIELEPEGAAESSPASVEDWEKDLAIETPAAVEDDALSEDDLLKELSMDSAPVEARPEAMEAGVENFEEPALPTIEAPVAEVATPTTGEPELTEDDLLKELSMDSAPAEARPEVTESVAEIETPIEAETLIATPMEEPAAELHLPIVAEESAAVEPTPELAGEEPSPVVMESVVPEDLTYDVLPETAGSQVEEEAAPQEMTFDPAVAASEPASTTSADFDLAPLEPEAPAPEALPQLRPIEELFDEPRSEDSKAADTEVFFGDEPIEEIIHADAAKKDDAADLAPVAESSQPAEPEAVEVIEATEPTVESALRMDEVATPAEPATEEMTVAEPSLSDTTFGRQVSEFAGESADPIVVEATPESPVLPPMAEEIDEPEMAHGQHAIEAPILENTETEGEAEPVAEEAELADEPLGVQDDHAQTAVEAPVLENTEIETPEAHGDEPMQAAVEVPVAESTDAEAVTEALTFDVEPIEPLSIGLEPVAEEPSPAVEVVEPPVEIVADPASAVDPTPGPLNFGVDSDDELVFDPPAEEVAVASAEVTVPAGFSETPETVQDVTPAFTAVEPEPTPAMETPLVMEESPMAAAPELGTEQANEAGEPASFEEEIDLAMTPEESVHADPVAMDDLPLEEFPEELPEATLETFELPVRSEITAIPQAVAEPEVTTTSSSQYQPRPLIPGMPLDLSETAVMPDFVGGLPLTLNELPPPPPTFGRVQVSFNGAVGPQSIVDEPITSIYGDEPGPFDNLQIDIENPVPHAAPVTHTSTVIDEPYADELVFEESLNAPEAPAVEEPAEPEVTEAQVGDEFATDESATEEFPAESEAATEEPAAEPEPVEPPPQGKRGLFANKLRVPPRPQRSESPAPDVEPGEFGAAAGAGLVGGFGAAAPGFGGLTAAPGVNNVDVFAQGFSADLSNDPIFGHAVKPMPKEPERKPRRKTPEPEELKFIKKSRRTLVTPPVGDVDELAGQLADDLGAPALGDLPPQSLEAQDTGATEGAIEARPQRRPVSPRGVVQPVASHEPAAFDRMPRRRNGGRVALLLVVMFLLMVAATFFIYTFLKQNVQISGTISYENFNKLTAAERHGLQESQKALLVSDQARHVAMNSFAHDHPGASYGFLGDPIDFGRNEVRVHWDKGTLVYNYNEGTDKALDVARVKATLEAVFKLDADMRLTAGKTRQQIDDMRANLDQKTRELANLEARRKDANDRMSHEPAGDQLTALRADAQAAEEAYWKAYLAAQQAGEEKSRIETAKSPSQAPAAATAATGDTQLDELSKSLDDMKNRLTTAKTTVSEQAEQARKQLDAAIEELQRSTAAAEDVLKGNPELSAFVAEAQKTQQTVQKLAGDLLSRQEKSYEKLLENKNVLEEHLAQRRKELWDSDLKIKRMKDDLAMRERGYNAAKDQGYDKEADQIHKELETTLADVEKRKLELESDPTLGMLTDLLARCTQDITLATRQLEADRKQADALTEQMQSNFARLAPAVKNLPEAERTLAQRMSAKMEAVTNARKLASEAIVAKDVDHNPVLAELEHQIEAKTALVEERKKAVESLNNQQMPVKEIEQRQAAVEQKRAMYAAAVKTKADAERVMFEKQMVLKRAEGQQSEAGLSRAEYDKLTQDAFNLRDKEIPQLKQSLQQAEQNALTLAYPSEPRVSEAVSMEDRRLPYTALTVAGIALVFSLMIFFTGSRQPAYDPFGAPVAAAPVPAGAEDPMGAFGLLHSEGEEPEAESGGTSAAA